MNDGTRAARNDDVRGATKMGRKEYKRQLALPQAKLVRALRDDRVEAWLQGRGGLRARILNDRVLRWGSGGDGVMGNGAIAAARNMDQLSIRRIPALVMDVPLTEES